MLPWASGRGGLNGDAAFLFFNQRIHRGGAFVHFTHAMNLSGVKKDALRDGGFTSIDVCANSNVSNAIEISRHSH